MRWRAIPTTNTAALEKYLLATQVAKRQTYDALFQAETYMQEATELDASFANAWAGLAQMRGELFRTGAIGLQQYADGATIAIAKALAIDPKNANALAVRGQVQTCHRRFVGSRRVFPGGIGDRARQFENPRHVR